MKKQSPCYKFLKKIIWKASGVYKIEPKTYQKAAEICWDFYDRGIYTTAGKFSKDGDSTDRIVLEYAKLSSLLKRNENIYNNFYLSVKPPALNFDLTLIENIAKVAKANGHSIHFDSHDYKMAMPTFKIVEEIKEKMASTNKSEDKCWWGITLPTRWKRSLEDAKWAIKNQLRVRLVKGEFRAGNNDLEIDSKKGYLKLVEMLSGKIPELAIATHDYELAKNAIDITKLKKQKVELELLYGMPVGKMMSLSKELDIPLRFYVPYGDTLLVYGVIHILKYPNKLFRSNPACLIKSHKKKLEYIYQLL